MYTSSTMTFELAKTRHHDLLVQAAKDSRARRVRGPAPAPQPPASRSGRAWQLVPHLHPQAQS